jgi:hypothetical protein
MAYHGLAVETKEKEQFIKNVFRKREFPSDYNADESSSIKRVIYNPQDLKTSKLINDEKKVILYGTSIFKGFPLAGDIDCMQIIPIQNQAKALRNVILKLISNQTDNNIRYFVGDIKCGLVSKFKGLSQYIGDYKNNKITGYNYNACKYAFNLSNDFKDNKLILPKKITNNKEFIEYLKCYDLAHELITRRWTVEDIVKGYQTNEDGTEYNLNEAVYDSQLTKLDLYYCGDIKIMECTNTFMKNEKVNIDSFNDSLKLNMLIQYFVKDKKLKAIKRMLALTRINKEWDLCLLLHDFTQRSITGKYNEIVNNLKVLLFIFENYGSTFQLNKNEKRDDHFITFTGMIQNLLQKIYQPYKKVYKNIIDGFDEKLINPIVDKDYSGDSLFSMINFIKGTINYFEIEIDYLTKKFIKDNNINFEKYLMF